MDNMRIILTSTPLSGHVTPMIQAGRVLQDAGHQVAFTTAEPFRARAEAAGLYFVPAPNGAHLDLSDLDSAYPERKNIPVGLERFTFDIVKIHLEPMKAQYHGLCTLLEQFPADVILSETGYLGAQPIVLGALGKKRPVVANLGVVPMPLHRDDGALFGPGLMPVAPDSPEAVAYRKMANELAPVWNIPLTDRVNSILAELGATELPCDLFDALIRVPDIHMQLGVRSFEVPRSDLPDTVQFIGNLPSIENNGLSADLQAHVDSGKRLVIVTQGTLENRDLSQLLAPTIRALAERQDIIVIATTGGRPVKEIGMELPSNAFISTFVPLYALLKHASLVVTNGGYGTICLALQQGVPLVVSGEDGDKPENGMRVAQAGAGISLGKAYPTVQDLSAAIDTVLREKAYAKRVRELAAEFDQHNAVVEMVQLMKQVSRLNNVSQIS